MGFSHLKSLWCFLILQETYWKHMFGKMSIFWALHWMPNGGCVRAGRFSALPLRGARTLTGLSHQSASEIFALKGRIHHASLSSGVGGPSCSHAATVQHYWPHDTLCAPLCIKSWVFSQAKLREWTCFKPISLSVASWKWSRQRERR